ncbi:MAG: CRISPR-associated endoribonuclease Cas6 [Thermoplasmata archaeon]|nr:MAG: CRISPR-associated endoribonuclease Cas6 [Thermoplasmata archaeon]
MAEKPQIIPINYNYHLASLIYRRIEAADSDLSLSLHKPYVIKFFTFSKLMARKKVLFGDQMKVDGRLYFDFSSPKKDIIVALVNGMLEKPNVKIANANFILGEVKVLREPEIRSKETFSTLSPISVTTVKNENGHKKIVDLYPKEPKFYDNIKKNLIKKYVLLYGREPKNDDLEIKAKKTKPKRIKIKNTFHRCSEMVFEANGNKELLKIGYQAGFGERNSMGFGMVKII